MLLTITTTHQPATDLGFLLYKHPGEFQTFEQSFGNAHVFYPEATDERCTVALLLEIDPVGLVRNRKNVVSEGYALQQYVNDKPYVASSFFSVAMGKVFRTAMSGVCRDKEELAATPIPLEAEIACLPCRGGEVLLRKLFEPLGYTVECEAQALDEKFPEWGNSRYYTVKLGSTRRLSELLTHLYVLIPVLDDDKHYWVGDEEVEKLLRHGKDWLPSHPEKETITRRYLQYQKSLTREALARISDEDEADPDRVEERHAAEEQQLEERLSLNQQRVGAVLGVLREADAARVIDLGCGQGTLIKELLNHKEFTELVGMDVSYRALEVAARRLRFERMPDKQKERIKLLQGSLTYRDKRMSGFDAATCIEVIEHLDPPRLEALERTIFEFARPKLVVLTTPNCEFNVKFESLPAGHLRHRDHRFEWTRDEFRTWANQVAERHGYSVRFMPIGLDDPQVGPPTQMAVFKQ